MSKLACPKDPKHKLFTASVHRTEDWIVDEHGEYVNVIQNLACEITTGPDYDTSVCFVCGADATNKETK